MCYSVAIQPDLAKLALNFSAHCKDTAFDQLTRDPGHFKVADADNRIFAKYYAPVVYGASDRVIEPMRYSTYVSNHIAQSYISKVGERQFKRYTSFNARRDNLKSLYWSEGIGTNHGVVVIQGFFEWVQVKDLLRAGVITLPQVIAEFARQFEERRKRWAEEGKDMNRFKPTKTELKDPAFRSIVIEFRAQQGEDLMVPVIFTENAEGQKGFAIITDKPNAEVKAAGHDRQPICLTKEAADIWLGSAGKPLSEIDDIFNLSRTNFYKHHLAKAA